MIKIDFKKIFSNKKENLYHSFRMMRPNHDWKILISISIFLALSLVVMSFYFLNESKKEDTLLQNNPSNTKKSLINQELLDKTLRDFSTKAKKVNNFPKNTVTTTDPNK